MRFSMTCGKVAPAISSKSISASLAKTCPKTGPTEAIYDALWTNACSTDWRLKLDTIGTPSYTSEVGTSALEVIVGTETFLATAGTGGDVISDSCASLMICMELVDLAHVSYSGGLFTYYAQVWKQPKYNHTAIGNLIQHKLPWSLSPVAILLFAVILPWMKEEGITFTPNQLRDEMLLIFKELYELHDNQTVTLEDLRQFCAGFINWAMPDNTGAVSRSRHSFIPTNYHF